MVSKVELLLPTLQVLTVMVPEAGATHVYHMDFCGPVPDIRDSPVSGVAATFEPTNDPVAPEIVVPGKVSLANAQKLGKTAPSNTTINMIKYFFTLSLIV
jgi:hypothetical protein